MRKENKKKIEFSKLVMAFVMFTYFVGVYLGYDVVKSILYVAPESAVQALLGYFTFIGSPIVTTVGFYYWKAKSENVPKIQNSSLESDMDEILYRENNDTQLPKG